jgi:hypothetical protein
MCDVCGEKRNICRISVGKTGGKKALEGLRFRCEDNIKVN